MPTRRKHADIITFKADPALRSALRGVANRSEFIRAAVLTALQNVCPLCGGSGILTLNQRKHWDAFAADHAVAECGKCHERHLVCAGGERGAVHGHEPA
jgi:hypothetical protein